MSSGRSHHPIRTALSGAAAGAVGTAAMDLVLFARYRRGGGTQKALAWETAEGVDTWDKASGPGRVGQLLLRFLTGREPPERWARPMTNLVHWITGIGWGAQFGLLNDRPGRHPWKGALLLGPTAWLTSYVVLPLAKVYKPIWDYDAVAPSAARPHPSKPLVHGRYPRGARPGSGCCRGHECGGTEDKGTSRPRLA